MWFCVLPYHSLGLSSRVVGDPGDSVNVVWLDSEGERKMWRLWRLKVSEDGSNKGLGIERGNLDMVTWS